MIGLDLSNSTLEEIKEENLSELLNKIHAKKQGFYYTIDDDQIIGKINRFAEKNSDFEHIVVCGIGGSALGAICLQQSLGHLYLNKLHVLDNIDPIMIKELEEVIDYSKTLFIVITKSGGTVETLSQYDYFSKKIKENGYELSDHMTIITGPQPNPLRDEAEKEDLEVFDIPEDVGGRFSVLTVVGLLPAKLIGIDIEKILKGAKVGRDNFLSPDSKNNLPYQLAKTQFDLSQKGKTINVLMPYSQKLIKFADWFRQLLAESTGKDGKGITPTNALGVTDQHSQLQLYNDGPNDKLFIFIEVKNMNPEIAIDSPYKTTFGELMQIEKNATAAALTKNGRPNITISVDSVSEETLGQLFLLFEGATAFLGELMGINAFDQPGVELSKKLTKKALLK
ncbi:MAG: glucose-6-phosphate isomerase [Nitrospirota bacterium]